MSKFDKSKKKAEIENINVQQICDEITAPTMTDKQRNYANVVLCPYFQDMTLSQMAEKAGITSKYANNLNKSYQFGKELQRFAKKIPQVYLCQIIAKLTKVAIETGSMPHAEFLLEYSGNYVRISRSINFNLNDKYKSLTDSELETMVKKA